MSWEKGHNHGVRFQSSEMEFSSGTNTSVNRSGWPSRGAINGAAVPSLANEANALSSLHSEARRNQAVPIFAFEYDDQLWKVNEDERSFGILGRGGIGSRAIASSC